MAELSIVIPTYNAARMLGPTLALLAQIESVGLIKEVVVADGGSTDHTVAIAREAGALVVISNLGRGQQLKTGASVATGAWLLFLHADTLLEAGWSEVVREFIGHPNTRGMAGYFRFALGDHTPMARRLERTVHWRNRVLALPYGDQGLLLSKSLYEHIGGYRPLQLMEDVDLIRRIGRRRLRQLGATAITSAERYRKEGYLQRSARNLICLGLYYLGVPTRLILWLYE
ncbi:MAG: TIGR04283 family arsenosugar biosynthesis glycosyltransferase [Pseudomonadota bacterium]|nr:TIGR04283 family arsenosugar biosynthesis glycosyltransferase [Pseudomonadota bacterium]